MSLAIPVGRLTGSPSCLPIRCSPKCVALRYRGKPTQDRPPANLSLNLTGAALRFRAARRHCSGPGKLALSVGAASRAAQRVKVRLGSPDLLFRLQDFEVQTWVFS